MAAMLMTGGTAVAATCTATIADVPAGYAPVIYSVTMGGLIGAGVTSGNLNINSIDASGTGTRTIYLPCTASTTFTQQLSWDEGLPLWRSSGTGYSVTWTLTGGNFTQGTLVVTYRLEKVFAPSTIS